MKSLLNFLYSTKEATPRKDPNQVIPQLGQNKMNNESDDSLSQISQILGSNRKDMNYTGLIGKFPGIYEEPNYIYDQMIYNKSRINKSKKLLNKISALKLPMSIISSKEALNQSSNMEKKCLSERAKIIGTNNQIKKSDDNADVSCCFFR